MPKILGESLTDHRELVRRRILDGFVSLLGARGYAAISMADLATEAGIGRTVVYNYFADKDAVVVALAGDETTRYLTELHQQLAEVDAPVDRLRVYVRHHLAAAAEHHLALGPELYAMVSKSSLSEIRAHVVDVEVVLRDILSSGVEAGDFRVEDVGAAVALVHACLQPRHLQVEAVEAFVLRGVGAAV